MTEFFCSSFHSVDEEARQPHGCVRIRFDFSLAAHGMFQHFFYSCLLNFCLWIRFFAGCRSNHGDNHLWRMHGCRCRIGLNRYKRRTNRLFNFIDIGHNLNDKKICRALNSIKFQFNRLVWVYECGIYVYFNCVQIKLVYIYILQSIIICDRVADERIKKAISRHFLSLHMAHGMRSRAISIRIIFISPDRHIAMHCMTSLGETGCQKSMHD